MEVPRADFRQNFPKALICWGCKQPMQESFAAMNPLPAKSPKRSANRNKKSSRQLSPIWSPRQLRRTITYCGGTTLKYLAGMVRSIGVIQSKPPSGTTFETTGTHVVRSDDVSMTKGVPFGPETWSLKNPSPMA